MNMTKQNKKRLGGFFLAVSCSFTSKLALFFGSNKLKQTITSQPYCHGQALTIISVCDNHAIKREKNQIRLFSFFSAY